MKFFHTCCISNHSLHLNCACLNVELIGSKFNIELIASREINLFPPERLLTSSHICPFESDVLPEVFDLARRAGGSHLPQEGSSQPGILAHEAGQQGGPGPRHSDDKNRPLHRNLQRNHLCIICIQTKRKT